MEQAIQVCYELIPENNKRAFGCFVTIEDDVKVSKKIIITFILKLSKIKIKEDSDLPF